MRRKRFQKGSVRPRKHGRNKVWVAQWWEDGCHVVAVKARLKVDEVWLLVRIGHSDPRDSLANASYPQHTVRDDHR